MRDKLSTAANDVIDVLPNSRLKGALIKINNAAQNKAYDKPAIDYSVSGKNKIDKRRHARNINAGYEG